MQLKRERAICHPRHGPMAQGRHVNATRIVWRVLENGAPEEIRTSNQGALSISMRAMR